MGLECVDILEGLGLKSEQGNSEVRALLAGPFGGRVGRLLSQLEAERGGSRGWMGTAVGLRVTLDVGGHSSTVELVEVQVGVLRARWPFISSQRLKYEMGTINRNREGWGSFVLCS